MSSRAQYIVLCEDLQSQVFIRRALIRRGANGRRIRLSDLPSGGGAGDQYVLTAYPSEVEAHRAQGAHTQAALVVHIDADPGHSVADRHRQLAESLESAGQAPRGAEERIAHLVPKRNIETWIHFYLDGPPIAEEAEYAKYANQSDCWPAAERFSDDAKQDMAPEEAPPSLVQGLSEFRRVL